MTEILPTLPMVMQYSGHCYTAKYTCTKNIPVQSCVNISVIGIGLEIHAQIKSPIQSDMCWSSTMMHCRICAIRHAYDSLF